MFDLMFTNNGEIQFKDAINSAALGNQMALFCKCRERELSYDIAYGLDYDILLNGRVSNEFKENMIMAKLKRYFSYKLRRIHNVIVTRENRHINIRILYSDIYSNEVRTIETT